MTAILMCIECSGCAPSRGPACGYPDVHLELSLGRLELRLGRLELLLVSAVALGATMSV